MRKATKRKPVTARAPMLVVMHNTPELSLAERMSVEAFAGGWAEADHFNNLSDCRNILMFAAADKRDQQALDMAALGHLALLNIHDRYTRTGRFGTAGDELQALRALVDFSEDWWKRQPGSLFSTHYNALRRHRQQACQS